MTREQMTREQAIEASKVIETATGIKPKLHEHGFMTGNYRVEIWIASTGSNNLTQVDHIPTAAEAKKIVREARKAAKAANDRTTGLRTAAPEY